MSNFQSTAKVSVLLFLSKAIEKFNLLTGMAQELAYCGNPSERELALQILSA